MRGSDRDPVAGGQTGTPATDWSGRTLHFVGIGGAGMSGLALVASALGAAVSGSDRAESAYTDRLRAAGIEPVLGHAAANVPSGAEVVFSTAIPADNPELHVGGVTLHRSRLLSQIASLRRSIAVTGSHGKTTTAGMIVHVLRELGMDPPYLLGGELRSTGSNAGWGTGEWIVVEADESDRSLLALDPDIALLTNAELDHHATYHSRLELEQTLREFLASARAHVVVWDRPQLRALAGPGAVAYDAEHVRLTSEGVQFRWREHEVALLVLGAHNAVNAAGALTAATLAGAEPTAAARAIAGFLGARRRLEALGTSAGGAALYDDYAHHPTEVAATVAAARTLEHRRLVAIFQPHLYSRTAILAREFGAALGRADVVVVLDVYPARERAEDHPGVSGLMIAEAAADAAMGRAVYWLPGFDDARAVLEELLVEGDVCLVMGAGDVDELGRALVGA
jgi:UDP-N-acetylmuramate--alanine ligase